MGGFQRFSVYDSEDKYSCWEINPSFRAQRPLLGTFYIKILSFNSISLCLVSWQPLLDFRSLKKSACQPFNI
jgi:hypothetical protein